MSLGVAFQVVDLIKMAIAVVIWDSLNYNFTPVVFGTEKISLKPDTCLAWH